MTAPALSFTEDQTFAALRAVLLGMVGPGVEVIMAQDNMVPAPLVGDYILTTPTRRTRLATNVVSWAEPAPDSLDRETSTELDVQLDVHGPSSGDTVEVIVSLMRDAYAVDAFAAQGLAVTILSAEDGAQMAFVNDQNQYEDRWVLNVSLQAKPVISTGQQFADTLTAGLIEVDTTYPP